MKVVKGFKISEDTLKVYEDLKQKEQINSDSEFFAKMLDYTRKAQKKQVKLWLRQLLHL